MVRNVVLLRCLHFRNRLSDSQALNGASSTLVSRETGLVEAKDFSDRPADVAKGAEKTTTLAILSV